MHIGTKIFILWMGLLASGYGSVSDDNFETGFSSSDGAFYTDDAVIINGEYSSEYKKTWFS